MQASPDRTAADRTIRVFLPAAPEFLVGLRVMARTAAALSDLVTDDIEDMQMAVDEAANLLVPLLADDGDRRVTGTFDAAPASLRAEVSVQGSPGATVERDGLAWLMLTGLVPTVEVRHDGALVSIAVTRSRESAEG